MTRAESIAEITGRLVEYYQPERIYLFGSVARGNDTPESDLDSDWVYTHPVPGFRMGIPAEFHRAVDVAAFAGILLVSPVGGAR